MLVGFGCTVPGVMASRTLPSERARKMTILLTPFMSCSAKLPIYAFFTAAFFPKYGALVMIALYFGGIIMGILMALIFGKTMFKGEAVPFVMAVSYTHLLGIGEVHSELLPADKVSKVEELLANKSEKEKLAFVGDGINDAPVLSRARCV